MSLSERRLGLAIAGVQKAGTTSLFGYLRRHPALLAPNVKETHFFDDEEMDWSNPDYSRLMAHFPPGDAGKVLFEGTPVYGFWPGALERLRAHNPRLKLIFVFRDPIERAWSQWRMSRERGWERLGFSEAIREGRERLVMGEPSASLKVHSYVERGFYAEQLRHALTLFPREQILLLLSSELQANHPAVLERIAHFLCLPPFPAIPALRAHATEGDNERMSVEDETYLRGLFYEDVEAFAALSRLNVGNWLTMLRDR